MINEKDFDPMMVPGSAASVVVMTPSLMNNDKIVNVLSGWVQMSESTGELQINEVDRIFKILKGPFNADSYLPELKDYMSYDFYYHDPKTGESSEFSDFFVEEAENSFWMKLVDLAYDLNKILKGIHEKTSSSSIVSDRNNTVYLASTGIDLLHEYDMIKRELKRHGFDVLPKNSFPEDIKSIENSIREDLSKSRLAIHMVGEDYGVRPANSELSVVDIQSKLSNEYLAELRKYNKDHNEPRQFSRLIWVSPELKNISERQKLFIEELKSEASNVEESEVIQVSIQELKGIIREEMVSGGRFKARGIFESVEQEEDNTRSIYLIQDKSDRENSKNLKSFLKKRGFKILEPSYDGDVVDIRYIHQEHLKKCDASIIYFNNASEDWIIAKLQDTLKAPGFGRKKPFLAKAIYVDGDKSIEQIELKKYNTLVISNKGEFKSDLIVPFLEKIEVQ
jgi:hypothetical protein